MDPLVSIIILSWNRKDDLNTSLKHIFDSSYKNFEVIVIDNGSTDGTLRLIKNEFPTVKLVALTENIGIAGYNEGFKIARGQYIIVLDDDSYPANDALAKAVMILEKERLVVGIAFNIIHPTNNISESAGWPENVFTFIGCGAILRRDVLEKAGYFDPTFFLYCNEFDLTIRMLDQNNQYTLKYFTNIVAYHNISVLNRTSARRAYYQLRNNLWILWQHFSFWNSFRLSFRRIFEELVFAFTWHKSLSAYFRGLFSAFTNLPRCLRKRKVISLQLEQKLITTDQPVFGEPIPTFLLNNIRSINKKFTRHR